MSIISEHMYFDVVGVSCALNYCLECFDEIQYTNL